MAVRVVDLLDEEACPRSPHAPLRKRNQLFEQNYARGRLRLRGPMIDWNIAGYGARLAPHVSMHPHHSPGARGRKNSLFEEAQEPHARFSTTGTYSLVTLLEPSPRVWHASVPGSPDGE